MMSLGHHLGADQDPGRARQHAADDGFELFGPRRAVAVEPDQRLLGEQFAQGFLDPLGALADRLDSEAAAQATLRQRLDRPAMVAAQLAAGPMHRQARVTGMARGYPAAGGTQQRRRVAAPVDEHQHLPRGR
jgi:hypothetical protein